MPKLISPKTKRTILLSATFAFPWFSLHAQTFLEPPDGRVYHGVQTFSAAHVGYLAALNDSTIQPAVRGTFVSIPGTRAPANTYSGLRSFFASADSFGFIPEVGLFLVTSNASPTGATDSIIAMTTLYDAFLDTIITISQNYGKRMFVRIGGEFNGWWNGGGYHPYYYVTAFRKICDMYSAHGIRDSIATVWCYEPDAANDFDSVGVNGPLWYPGDPYVNWFGLDVFDAGHFDQSLPDTTRGEITHKGKSERFLHMARAQGKPVYLNETSAKGVTITADSVDSYNDWNAWFAKFWVLMDNHVEIKGFNYTNQDWEHTGYPGWGDARIQNSTYITNWYRQEMHRPRYVHIHSSLAEVVQRTTTPHSVSLAQNYPNPFNPTTTISFSIPRSTYTTLKIFNMLGQEVAALVSDDLNPGPYSRQWNARGVASGVYYYRLQAGEFVQTKKLILMK